MFNVRKLFGRVFFIAVLSLLASFSAHAQCSNFRIVAAQGQLTDCVAASRIQTGQIVSLSSSSQVAPISAGSTAGVFGVALNSGASGATVQVLMGLGAATISVDSACTVGNVVAISPSFNGNGHCTSSPTTQTIGTAMSAATEAGSVSVQISIGSASSSGTVVSGTQGQVAIYSTGAAIGSSGQSLDITFLSGTHWTDKTATAITQLGAGGGVVVIPVTTFSGDDGSATNLTVPSNVTLQFTGYGTLTFCASGNGITVASVSNIVTSGKPLLQMKSGGSCARGIYLNGQETLQSNDRLALANLRLDCNNVAGSVGWYFTGGTAVLNTEYNSVSNCPNAGVIYNDAQFTNSIYDHFWNNGVNVKLYSTTGATNSNSFYHLQANNPTLGENVMIVQTGSAIGQGDIDFYQPELQNGTVNEMCVIGATYQTTVHIYGGAPEVGGNQRSTVTFTNSSAVITGPNTYTSGQTIQFDTTGTLPTNFSPDTTYYVISTGLSGSQFEVSSTLNGSAITAGSAGSGTDTAFPVAVIDGNTCRQAMIYANNSSVLVKDMDVAESVATPLFYAANASDFSITDSRGGSGQLTAYADSTSTVAFYGMAAFAGGVTTSGAGTFTGVQASGLFASVPNPTGPLTLGIGSASAPPYSFLGHTTSGLYSGSTGVPCISAINVAAMCWFGGSNNYIPMLSNQVFGWTSSSSSQGAPDTGLYRISGQHVGCGNGNTSDSSCTLQLSRLVTGNQAPTCAFTSGGGTSPSCTLDTSSDDSGGIIIATTGTGSPAGTGTITLTFSTVEGAFGTHNVSCVFEPSSAGTGQWAALAAFADTTPSSTSDVQKFTNGTTPTALSTSTAYWINYHCRGKS